MPVRKIMAGLLTDRSADFLAGSEVREVVSRFGKSIDSSLSRVSTSEAVMFLGDLRERLEQEREAESAVEREFALLRDKLSQARRPEELSGAYRGFRDATAAYFMHRRGVAGFFSLTSAYRDLLVSRVLQLAAERLRPVSGTTPEYAWIALGREGREEPLPVSGHEAVLVYRRQQDRGYFTDFSGEAELLLREVGMWTEGTLPSVEGRRATLAEWAQRIEACFDDEECGAFVDPGGLADARAVVGAGRLADEFFLGLRKGLGGHSELLRRMTRHTSTMPLAVRFLGWFRVERSGAHRGEINLRQYAIDPLVSNLRLMAAGSGIWSTGTVARIRGLLHRGRLDVLLAERLLKGFLDFCGFEIETLLKTMPEGAETGYVSPDFLTTEEEQVLREGLEAVETLQRIMYTEYAGLG